MTLILDQCPYDPQGHRIHFDGQDHWILANQLVVWLTLARQPPDPEDFKCFPAVIDTGYGGTFILNHKHWTNWCRLKAHDLVNTGHVENLYGFRVPRFEARLWMHVKQPVALDEDRAVRAQSMRTAVELSVTPGVCIMCDSEKLVPTPNGMEKQVARHARKNPSIPLIGMALLERNRMQLSVDAVSHTFSLSTTRSDWQPPASP